MPAGHDTALNYPVMSRDRSAMEMVQQAVDHNQVMLAYQPVVPARSPAVPAFYEGLIRILDETGRIIPAREFIEAVETTETGRQIDCLALEKGLRTLMRQPDLRLSINMSARSIGYPRWMRTLQGRLDEQPTDGRAADSGDHRKLGHDRAGTGDRLHEGSASRGVSFALDDFGAGFTSFRYLRDFYFDIVKIDGQFIRGIADSADNQVLTSALSAIATQFDMLTVAESVETARDAEYLAAMGIDCLQGYFFGAPTVNPPWQSDAPDQAIG